MSIASRVAPGRARQSPADAGRTRYWAFISYSRDDELRARSLHGRLELNRRTIVSRSPNRSAQAIEGEFDASTAVVVGRVKGTSWYLVDAWKGVAGFVRDPTAA